MGLAEAAPEPVTGSDSAGESLQKKGFVVTGVDAVMNWARTGSLWPMTAAITIIPMPWCGAVTASYPSTFTYLAVRRQLKP